MQHDQNEKRTAPEGTAQDSDYYFALAVLLAGGGSLLRDLLTREDSSHRYYGSDLRAGQWQEGCNSSNRHLN
jgi:hypothetical protein